MVVAVRLPPPRSPVASPASPPPAAALPNPRPIPLDRLPSRELLSRIPILTLEELFCRVIREHLPLASQVRVGARLVCGPVSTSGTDTESGSESDSGTGSGAER